MVVLDEVLFLFTVIAAVVEVLVGVGLLKQCIADVFLVISHPRMVDDFHRPPFLPFRSRRFSSFATLPHPLPDSISAILIIEDDDDIRSANQAALELEGYQVIEALLCLNAGKATAGQHRISLKRKVVKI